MQQLRFISSLRGHIDGLVQERRNSIALEMELRLSCTNPSTHSVSTDEMNHDGWIYGILDYNHDLFILFILPRYVLGELSHIFVRIHEVDGRWRKYAQNVT